MVVLSEIHTISSAAVGQFFKFETECPVGKHVIGGGYRGADEAEIDTAHPFPGSGTPFDPDVYEIGGQVTRAGNVVIAVYASCIDA